MAADRARTSCALSLRIAFSTGSSDASGVKLSLTSEGSSIAGRRAAASSEALVEADFWEPAVASTLSLLSLSGLSPLQADSVKAAAAVSVSAASRVGRRFTNGSW
ncbi:hypothetical protein C6Y14_08440 [Streptomyces dioscori]|uniref:Uncharacterized protein n=1 Tax=Streptomyces dioscori TaxID=2109333 RepID=A0A2P8QBQ1_9ACTN|nr:hypothetical protein C6Y14_08440 [Streptomyces dioscori]